MINFWLFVHLTGLVLLAAGVGIANLSGIMMSKSDSPSMIAMWSKVNFRVEHIATLPGALLLVVAGSILVHKEGYDYSATWIVSAYVLWVIAVFIGAGVLGRHAHRIHKLACDEVAAGVEVSTTASKLARSPLGPVAGNLLNLILLAFLYLMIVKPS
ncbi:MAG: putative integral rane protein [Gaiellales bacterium]|jgi:uncharacterized membrane protein|nr:putative integral rane protein [Gaiellales bacterium]